MLEGVRPASARRTAARGWLLGSWAVAVLTGCNVVLGLGDLRERDRRAAGDGDDAGSEASGPGSGDAGTDLGEVGDGGTAGDGEADAADTDPCDFADVTDPSITGHPDFAGWPMPNTGTVNQSSYSVDGGVVHDNVTKLDWMETPAPGYDYTPATAQSYCQARPSDGAPWRLPTRIELITLQRYKPGATSAPPAPCLDETKLKLGPEAFPPLFLTSTPTPAEPGKSWVVLFSTCGAQASLATSGYVRCVRGAPVVPKFQISTKCNIVRDLNTHLEWQRNAKVLPPPIREGNVLYAENYCSSIAQEYPLMGGGWVLPTQVELYSMFDSSRASPPLVSPTLFTDTPGSGKIISSTLRGTEVYGAIQLPSGEESGAFFTEGALLRCVRHF